MQVNPHINRKLLPGGWSHNVVSWDEENRMASAYSVVKRKLFKRRNPRDLDVRLPDIVNEARARFTVGLFVR